MSAAPKSTLKLYELVGKYDSLLISPWVWTVRFALFHKQVQFESVPWRRVDKEAIAFTGQGKVPVLVDGDRHIVDSWQILKYLEATYTDAPKLFGPSGEIEPIAFFVRQVFSDVLTPILAVIAFDIQDTNDPRDREFWRKHREEILGTSLEEFVKENRSIEAVRAGFAPLRKTLQDYPFLGGLQPNAADYTAVGPLMWARTCSAQQLLEVDDPVNQWKERMLDLFNGMARNTGSAESFAHRS